jgi:hypothetical protein
VSLATRHAGASSIEATGEAEAEAAVEAAETGAAGAVPSLARAVLSQRVAGPQSALQPASCARIVPLAVRAPRRQHVSLTHAADATPTLRGTTTSKSMFRARCNTQARASFHAQEGVKVNYEVVNDELTTTLSTKVYSAPPLPLTLPITRPLASKRRQRRLVP